MFAAGRKASGTGAGGGDAAQVNDDWLSVGKSFASGTGEDKPKARREDTEASESALQVYKHSKHRHKEKKKKKEKKQRSSAVDGRHLSKHKKKSKDRKRRRSWSPSGSSDEDDTHRSRRRSRRRRHRSRSNSRSRSASRPRSHRDESRIVTQSDKALALHETPGEEKLFEVDCVGDRENRFFGSTYAHDQPLYDLATRRNLLTGAWISRTRPKLSGVEMHRKQKENQGSDRYFSVRARKMERDGRQKRLYLAYSEKRLSRVASSHQADHSDQTTKVVVSCLPEMSFIPVDPVLEINNLVGDDIGDHSTSDEVMLTDGQSVEQHLVDRSKLLNAAVAADPRDTDKWLDLIAFQEQTIRLHTRGKKIDPAVRASVVEKQSAILSKALTYNPQSRRLHRVKLNMTLQAQIKGEGAAFDSFQRQLETLLLDDLTNCDLWLKLLQSRQQHFGSFSMQSVRDLYARILNVLRVETEKQAKTKAESAKPLHGVSEPLLLTTKSEDLATLLLDFHLLMCIFEAKAGYTERSIAQMQALIGFNLNESATDKRPDTNNVSHLDMLRSFVSRWNDVGSVRFGDEQWGTSALGCAFEQDSPELSDAGFEEFIHTKCVTTIDQVNPPDAIRSQEHKQSLLFASADYQRKSKINSGRDAGAGSDVNTDLAADFVACDDSDTDSRRSGTVVYSNLHGYRISIDDMDDTKEYERILCELRGTETARARQDQLIEKEQAKREMLAVTKAQLEDQRADFGVIGEDDHFMKWLVREEVQIHVQWSPLRASNPLHQELIEQQPDRAILTDEIQPFLFTVPAPYRWRLVAQLLRICGVQWRGEYQWDDSLQFCQWMYADDAADCEQLVNPILSAFSPRPTKHTLVLDPYDRKMILETVLLNDIVVKDGVIRDPKKVAFVRRIFMQALSVFQTIDEKFGTTLKCLLISFEAEVTRATGDDEAFVMYARRLSQQLVQRSVNGDTDFDVLFAYAKLELKLGNERQVRRICDNTLASLSAPSQSDASVARHFHRFVFLRARLEMWPLTKNQKKLPETLTCSEGLLRVLRCLYTLWSAQQPEQGGGIKKEALDTIAKVHRKRIYTYLENILKSDPLTETSLIAWYRTELSFAIRHCAELSSQPHDAHSALRKPHDCWVGYCLHNLALVIYAYRGFEAACQEYRQGLTEVKHQACSHLNWMWICFLEFMQQHQTLGLFPAVAPRAWRESIGDAVEKFPSNALFLRLFVDAETGNTISQVLRNYFLQVEKRWRRHYDSPELVEWLFALLCELCRAERAAMIKCLAAPQLDNENRSRPMCCLFHRWGMNGTAVTRIRQMFESMVSHIRTKGSALCWRLYMRFEIALGKVDAAKKILYRGIAACAWSKALYMDGLRVLRAYLSEDECHELLELLEAKELNVRVDF